MIKEGVSPLSDATPSVDFVTSVARTTDTTTKYDTKTINTTNTTNTTTSTNDNEVPAEELVHLGQRFALGAGALLSRGQEAATRRDGPRSCRPSLHECLVPEVLSFR